MSGCLGKIWNCFWRINNGRFEINQLLFVDDTTLLADSEEKLCKLVSEFGRVCERRKLRENVCKIKLMMWSRYLNIGWGRDTIGEPLEEVPSQKFIAGRRCYWSAIVGNNRSWSFCQKDHLWWVGYVRLSLSLSICGKPIHKQHRSQLGLPYIPNVSFFSVQYIHNLHKLSPNGCSSFENTTIIQASRQRLQYII